jgi:excisionase family DNA binding protein
MNLGVLEKTETVTAKRLAYGLDELAEMTGLSVAFLRKLARAGTLKTRKFGARRMVLDADLQEFLKGETTEVKTN